jgi:hypothetical protein
MNVWLNSLSHWSDTWSNPRIVNQGVEMLTDSCDMPMPESSQACPEHPAHEAEHWTEEEHLTGVPKQVLGKER